MEDGTMMAPCCCQELPGVAAAAFAKASMSAGSFDGACSTCFASTSVETALLCSSTPSLSACWNVLSDSSQGLGFRVHRIRAYGMKRFIALGV